MDGIVRKHNSLRDIAEGNRNNYQSRREHNSAVDGWRYQNLSPSQADNNLMKAKDRSKWSSREQLNNDLEWNESVYGEMEDGWGERKHNHSPDNSLGKSRRYFQGRSGRSQSRDRGRTIRRSRSWSRGVGLGRDCSRSRSRSSKSRSRSRDRKRARSRTRSRSPFNGHMHKSYGQSDRSGSRLSSHSSRDVAVEKSRIRPELGHPGRYLNSERSGVQSREKVYDVNYGDDDTPQSRSRGAVTCRDFLKGKCKWGTSCRFAHHSSSADDNARNASFESDNELRSGETGKPMCKFFLSGKCQRVNCKFSHYVPTSRNLEDSQDIMSGGQTLANNDAWRNAPTWDDADLVSNEAKFSGWRKNAASNAGAVDAVVNDKVDDTWGQGSKSWVGVRSENNAFLDDSMSQRLQNLTKDRDMGSMQSPTTEILNEKSEDCLASKGLQPGGVDEISMISHGQNVRSGVSYLHHDVLAMHTEASIRSDIEYKKPGGDGTLKAYEGPDVLKDTGMAVNPPAQGQMHSDMLVNHSLVSNDHGDMMFSQNSSNQRSIDLDSPGHLLGSKLNLPNRTAKAPEMHDFAAPRSFLTESFSGPFAKVAYRAASPTRNFVNERVLNHPQEEVKPLNSTCSIASVQTLGHPVNMTFLPPNPAMRPPDYNLFGNVVESNPSSNSTLAPGNMSYPFEQHNGMILEPFSPPPSAVKSEFQVTVGSGLDEVQHHDTSEAKHQGANDPPEVMDNDKNDAVGGTEQQENSNKQPGKDIDKTEHGAGNKEEKETRLFKNALVEFVKDVLKPTWKEGRMSREVHKTIVKKVVDKVSSSIQANHIPKTKDRIEQYLSSSKTKISKLVQAYVERHMKAET